jgi:hypothetical protein
MKETNTVRDKLFVYLQYWMMFSMHTKDESRYRNEKKSCVDQYGRHLIEDIENKIINSSEFNKFLKNKGVDSRVGR